MTVTVKRHQCLLDILLQEAGSIEYLFDVAAANDMMITADLYGGQSLTLPEFPAIRAEVVTYFKSQHIHPATAVLQGDRHTGIGSMGIGIDFKTS